MPQSSQPGQRGCPDLRKGRDIGIEEKTLSGKGCRQRRLHRGQPPPQDGVVILSAGIAGEKPLRLPACGIGKGGAKQALQPGQIVPGLCCTRRLQLRQQRLRRQTAGRAGSGGTQQRAKGRKGLGHGVPSFFENDGRRGLLSPRDLCYTAVL